MVTGKASGDAVWASSACDEFMEFWSLLDNHCLAIAADPTGGFLCFGQVIVCGCVTPWRAVTVTAFRAFQHHGKPLRHARGGPGRFGSMEFQSLTLSTAAVRNRTQSPDKGEQARCRRA